MEGIHFTNTRFQISMFAICLFSTKRNNISSTFYLEIYKYNIGKVILFIKKERESKKKAFNERINQSLALFCCFERTIFIYLYEKMAFIFIIYIQIYRGYLIQFCSNSFRFKTVIIIKKILSFSWRNFDLIYNKFLSLSCSNLFFLVYLYLMKIQRLILTNSNNLEIQISKLPSVNNLLIK